MTEDNLIQQSLFGDETKTATTKNNISEFKNLTNIYQYFFSEDQGRYIIEVEKNNLKKVENILKKNSVHFDLLGETTDKEIIINDEPTFTVDKVTEFYKGWLYKYMS